MDYIRMLRYYIKLRMPILSFTIRQWILSANGGPNIISPQQHCRCSLWPNLKTLCSVVSGVHWPDTVPRTKVSLSTLHCPVHDAVTRRTGKLPWWTCNCLWLRARQLKTTCELTTLFNCFENSECVCEVKFKIVATSCSRVGVLLFGVDLDR